MTKPTVAILGASANRSKFGNKSVRAHLQKGYEVFPVNPRGGEIEGLKVYVSIRDLPKRMDRVSVYLPPAVGLVELDAIADHGPKEVWLNPGAESEALIRRADDLGLNLVVACSIVELGVSPAHL
jgi:predicted CoA-binding protein